MEQVMKILLCIAGMPYAEPTIDFGGMIASATSSTVTLLHIVHQKERLAAGESMLTAARDMLPGLSVDTRIRQGDPTKGILAEVRQANHDLLILGAHREASTTGRLLGSVTQQIIRRAPVSVLVVRRPKSGLQRTLICTGGADVSKPVIGIGGWLTRAINAQATLLHIVSPVPSMYTGLEDIEETLPELLRTDTPIAQHLRDGAEILAQHQVSAALRLRYGVAADEILRETHEKDYDLVIIGASGTAGRLKGWLLGNVTRQIVEHAPCSVLVVRQASRLNPTLEHTESFDA
jgi:nucleotide-binding universal stress UspA family protein